jgi:hypothetical protein
MKKKLEFWRENKMITLRQIKRVPKNHKIVIEVPDTIQENQIMEVILLCKELPKNDKGDKIAQLKDSQHDPLFLSDMQAVSDDFCMFALNEYLRLPEL